MDEAGARMRIRNMTLPKELRDLDEKLSDGPRRQGSRHRRAAVRARRRAARRGRGPEAGARSRPRRSGRRTRRRPCRTSTVEDIADVVSMSTGVPVSNLTEAETEKLLRMEGVLHERIIGQDEAVTALSKAIRRSRVGLEGSEAPRWFVHLPGPVGRGQDRAFQGAGRVPVQLRGRASDPSTCPSTWRSTR